MFFPIQMALLVAPHFWTNACSEWLVESNFVGGFNFLKKKSESLGNIIPNIGELFRESAFKSSTSAASAPGKPHLHFPAEARL